MVEEEKKEIDGTKENKEDMAPKEEVSPLDEARKLNEDNKKLLESLTKERERMEKAAANMMISGKGQTGVNTKPKEETDKEYAERLISKPYGDAKVETPE